jgi:hypothetical protein
MALAFSAPVVPETFAILTNGLTDAAVAVRDADRPARTTQGRVYLAQPRAWAKQIKP